MKIEIFDTAISNPYGIACYELQKELDRLQKQKKVQIKDIKPLLNHGQDVMVAIYYENTKSIVQTKAFTSESEANDFCRTHDVIKIDYVKTKTDGITSIVTYKEEIKDD